VLSAFSLAALDISPFFSNSLIIPFFQVDYTSIGHAFLYSQAVYLGVYFHQQ